MANKNTGLHQAKEAKKDEFYTQLADIERELYHYRRQFEGKTVLCNCDDPRVSNFFQYFALNFEWLGLKRLICTCYKNNNPDLFSQNHHEQAVYLIYEGDKNGNSVPDPEEIGVHPLRGDGDFRSRECIELLKQADIVVTNPPFSLFREYVKQLMDYNKKFLIIGHQNAITYQEIFPYIKQNRMWLGYGFNRNCAHFITPNYEDTASDADHREGMIRVSGVVWFTNLEVKKRNERMEFVKTYNPKDYPRYDNYDAIEVSKSQDIPEDYDGVMGVPITFMTKYNPEQFEIIGATESEGKGISNGLWDKQSGGPAISGGGRSTSISLSDLRIPGHAKYDRAYINGERKYARILIRHKR